MLTTDLFREKEMITYHKDGSLPENGEIFVFGSNLAGRHGAGAAKIAMQKFGAVYGVGFGLKNQSYAIPTKNEDIQTLPLWMIEKFIGNFIEFVRLHPELKFFITSIGCGLAGYTPEQIAPLFRSCPINNCSFPDTWKEYLDPNETEALTDAIDEYDTSWMARNYVKMYEELKMWRKLKDPHILHASLLRGIPAKLTQEQLKHLLGTDEQQ